MDYKYVCLHASVTVFLEATIDNPIESFSLTKKGKLEKFYVFDTKWKSKTIILNKYGCLYELGRSLSNRRITTREIAEI